MSEQTLPLRGRIQRMDDLYPHYDESGQPSDYLQGLHDGLKKALAEIDSSSVAAQPRPEIAEIEAAVVRYGELSAEVITIRDAEWAQLPKGYSGDYMTPDYVAAFTRRNVVHGELLALISRALAVQAFRETDVEEDVERTWQEFWRSIIAPDGVIDIGQIKRELFDFSELMSNAAEVYEHVTGGQITKVNTLPSVVRSVSDDYATKMCEEAEAEAVPAGMTLVPVAEMERMASTLGAMDKRGERANVKFGERVVSSIGLRAVASDLRALLPERGDE